MVEDDDEESAYEYWKDQIERGGQFTFQRPGKIEFENDGQIQPRKRKKQRPPSPRRSSSARRSRSPPTRRNASDISKCVSTVRELSRQSEVSDFSDRIHKDTVEFSSDESPPDCKQNSELDIHDQYSYDCDEDSSGTPNRRSSRGRKHEPQFECYDSSYPSENYRDENNNPSVSIDPRSFTCNYPAKRKPRGRTKARSKNKCRSPSRGSNRSENEEGSQESNVCRYPSDQSSCEYSNEAETKYDDDFNSSQSSSAKSRPIGHGDESCEITKITSGVHRRLPSRTSRQSEGDKSEICGRSRSSRGSSRARSVETAYESVKDNESIKGRKCKRLIESQQVEVTLSRRFAQCFGIFNLASSSKLCWCLLFGFAMVVMWARIVYGIFKKSGTTLPFVIAVYWLYFINVSTILLNLYQKVMITIECECMKIPNFIFYLFTFLGGSPGHAFSMILFHAKDRSIAHQNRFLLVLCFHVTVVWYVYKQILKL